MQFRTPAKAQDDHYASFFNWSTAPAHVAAVVRDVIAETKSKMIGCSPILQNVVLLPFILFLTDKEVDGITKIK